jgi:hypothetical protein
VDTIAFGQIPLAKNTFLNILFLGAGRVLLYLFLFSVNSIAPELP